MRYDPNVPIRVYRDPRDLTLELLRRLDEQQQSAARAQNHVLALAQAALDQVDVTMQHLLLVRDELVRAVNA